MAYINFIFVIIISIHAIKFVKEILIAVWSLATLCRSACCLPLLQGQKSKLSAMFTEAQTISFPSNPQLCLLPYPPLLCWCLPPFHHCPPPPPLNIPVNLFWIDPEPKVSLSPPTWCRAWCHFSLAGCWIRRHMRSPMTARRVIEMMTMLTNHCHWKTTRHRMSLVHC